MVLTENRIARRAAFLTVLVCLLITPDSGLQTSNAAAATGTIRGRVELRQPPADAEPRPNVADLGMHAGHGATGRKRAVVYLDPAPRAAFDVRDEPRARIDQQNEAFVPHVLAIVAGTTVDFPNSDRTYHNLSLIHI